MTIKGTTLLQRGRLSALLTWVFAGSSLAQPVPPPPLAPAPVGPPPPVRDPAATNPAPPAPTNVYSLGTVQLDKQNRAVLFPAVVNQRTGLVEYVVVTATGKTHESVFRTEAQPQQIHLAMLLLDAQPANTNFFPADLSIPPPGDPVQIEVRWQEGARVVRHALEEFVVTTNHQNPLSPGPWVYNGSFINDGVFVAQRDGSVVSVQIDPNALINNPRPGREDDELHRVNTPLLPPDGTPLQIAIRLPGTPPVAAAPATNAPALPPLGTAPPKPNP